MKSASPQSVNVRRTAVVTGATSGIGRASAELLADAGNRVIVIGRRRERLEEILRKYGNDLIYPIICDLKNEQELSKQIQNLPPDFSNIDCLINGAGLLLGEGKFEDISSADVQTMLDTNIQGLLNVTKSLTPKLVESGNGIIVNITSIGANYHYANGHIYAGTKAFVSHFGNCLRAELVDRKVKVTNIAPGRTKTEFSLVRFRGDSLRADGAYSDITPLDPMDVARAVVWAINQPAHVNINSIELMPADQKFAFA